MELKNTNTVIQSSNDHNEIFPRLAVGVDCLVPRRLSLDENVRAKEGGKETTGETCFACSLYPSHGPLRCITSHSRFALASTMQKTKRLRGGWGVGVPS